MAEETSFSSLSWFQKLWSQSPTIAILIIIIGTGFYGVWIWGSAYKEMKSERDEYRTLAMDSIKELERDALQDSQADRTGPAPAAAPSDGGHRVAAKPKAKATPAPVVKVVELKKRAAILDAKKAQ